MIFIRIFDFDQILICIFFYLTFLISFDKLRGRSGIESQNYLVQFCHSDN